MDVQFNPTTLRVQISNRTAGGTQAGAQARQRPGTGEMQVSFDLIFDTADEGTSEAGVSVLDRTATVERFVRPRGPRPGQEAPPRVLFEWGSFLVQGTMESANIDLDLFDANGVPLRAKVSVSIKGQDPRWTYPPAPANAAAAPGSFPARPGSGSALPAGSPGTQGNSQSPERIAQAMPGESLAQLAARNGFDPKAWRALAEGLSNPLQLTLGRHRRQQRAGSRPGTGRRQPAARRRGRHCRRQPDRGTQQCRRHRPGASGTGAGQPGRPRWRDRADQERSASARSGQQPRGVRTDERRSRRQHRPSVGCRCAAATALRQCPAGGTARPDSAGLGDGCEVADERYGAGGDGQHCARHGLRRLRLPG